MLELPEGLRWAETAAEEAGFETRRGAVPRRWAGDPGIIACIEAEIITRRQKKEEGLAALAAWKAEKAAVDAHLPKRPRGRPKGSRNKP